MSVTLTWLRQEHGHGQGRGHGRRHGRGHRRGHRRECRHSHGHGQGHRHCIVSHYCWLLMKFHFALTLLGAYSTDCDASGGPPGSPEAQIRSYLGWHSWSSALAPHLFKNRLQAGSSRLQVSPWYSSCIPHGDACTEINCSGPLPPLLDGERWSSCAENKNKNDWATKLRHFWACPLEQTAWWFEGPFPEFTCFQTNIEIVSV